MHIRAKGSKLGVAHVASSSSEVGSERPTRRLHSARKARPGAPMAPKVLTVKITTRKPGGSLPVPGSWYGATEVATRSRKACAARRTESVDGERVH